VLLKKQQRQQQQLHRAKNNLTGYLLFVKSYPNRVAFLLLDNNKKHV
jgi:hypothetical protein